MFRRNSLQSKNWGQDRVLLRIHSATRLARALGVSLEQFAVDGSGEGSEPAKGAPPKRGRKPRGKWGKQGKRGSAGPSCNHLEHGEV